MDGRSHTLNVKNGSVNRKHGGGTHCKDGDEEDKFRGEEEGEEVILADDDTLLYRVCPCCFSVVDDDDDELYDDDDFEENSNSEYDSEDGDMGRQHKGLLQERTHRHEEKGKHAPSDSRTDRKSKRHEKNTGHATSGWCGCGGVEKGRKGRRRYYSTDKSWCCGRDGKSWWAYVLMMLLFMLGVKIRLAIFPKEGLVGLASKSLSDSEKGQEDGVGVRERSEEVNNAGKEKESDVYDYNSWENGVAGQDIGHIKKISDPSLFEERKKIFDGASGTHVDAEEVYFIDHDRARPERAKGASLNDNTHLHEAIKESQMAVDFVIARDFPNQPHAIVFNKDVMHDERFCLDPPPEGEQCSAYRDDAVYACWLYRKCNAMTCPSVKMNQVSWVKKSVCMARHDISNVKRTQSCVKPGCDNVIFFRQQNPIRISDLNIKHEDNKHNHNDALELLEEIIHFYAIRGATKVSLLAIPLPNTKKLRDSNHDWFPLFKGFAQKVNTGLLKNVKNFGSIPVVPGSPLAEYFYHGKVSNYTKLSTEDHYMLFGMVPKTALKYFRIQQGAASNPASSSASSSPRQKQKHQEAPAEAETQSEIDAISTRETTSPETHEVNHIVVKTDIDAR